MSIIYNIGRSILQKASPRTQEYAFAWKALDSCDSILDVACGTGTFISHAPEKCTGVDINPNNVAYCKEKGFNAQVGNALDLPFPDGHFDGVHSSHVIQVFAPDQAFKYVVELFRVCKPGGVVVITALNDFPRFWRHPENVRPYPPDALQRLAGDRKDAVSPMFEFNEPLDRIGITLVRPPLINFDFSSNPTLTRISAVLGALQSIVGLKKYWSYYAYTIAFRKSGGASE